MLAIYNSCKTFYTNNFTHNNSMDVIILFLYKETEAQGG